MRGSQEWDKWNVSKIDLTWGFDAVLLRNDQGPELETHCRQYTGIWNNHISVHTATPNSSSKGINVNNGNVTCSCNSCLRLQDKWKMKTKVACQRTEHFIYAISIKTVIRGIIWEWEIWVIPCQEKILMKFCSATQISLDLLLPTSISWSYNVIRDIVVVDDFSRQSSYISI